MKIFKPLGIHEIGQRQNNEDYIFPPKGESKDDQDFFVVCDGVGGSEKGEVASQLTCQSVADYLSKNPTDIPRQDYLKQMLIHCEDAFESYFAEHPETKGMGTTLTFLKLHDCGATVGHVGDSRVYHIRDGQIKHKTSDHSMVNEMVKAGLLTPEEAEDSPQKNVITRAVQGPHKRTRIDVKEINDVKAGDYFFLCTDGITESHSDFQLEQVFSKNSLNIDKIEAIKATCSENSRDNFSAYLVEIESHTPQKDKIETLQFGIEKPAAAKAEATSTATQLGAAKPETVEVEATATQLGAAKPEVTEVEVEATSTATQLGAAKPEVTEVEVEEDIVESEAVDDEVVVEEKTSIINHLVKKVKKKFLWMVLLIIAVCCLAFLYLGGNDGAKVKPMKVNSSTIHNGNRAAKVSNGDKEKKPADSGEVTAESRHTPNKPTMQSGESNSENVRDKEKKPADSGEVTAESQQNPNKPTMQSGESNSAKVEDKHKKKSSKNKMIKKISKTPPSKKKKEGVTK